MQVVIAFARDAAEETSIARVLEELGITYEIALDAFPDVETHGACLLGQTYSVDAADAARAAEALRRAGLGASVRAQSGE